MFTLKRGGCLELMRDVPDKSVDLILCDLPYGTTACKWDTIIPFDELWRQYNRIIKPGAAIVLTASQPFTTALISSNLECFCYSWIWDKQFGANFAQAKRQPLKVHEDVLVFSDSGKMPIYYPEMTKRDKPIKKGKNANESGAIPLVANESYNGKVYDEKYPSSILEFSCRDKDRGLHPTQKPVPLMEYLIKTYTNEWDTVLDNCMGSGTTGVACANTNRKFIGMELDRDYFRIARRRIFEAYKTKAP